MKNRISGGAPKLSMSDTPETKPGVWWVEVPRGNEVVKFLVYSPTKQGVNMHYILKEKRTVPCFENHDLCYGGHSLANLKWRCYVFGFSYKRRKNCFLQLTWEAWETWAHQLQPGTSLRGQTIQVHRTEKNNGRLWIEVETWREKDRADLPRNEDVTLSLYNLWEFDPSDGQAGARLYGDRFDCKNGAVLPPMV
jgi:hypothetical protein